METISRVRSTVCRTRRQAGCRPGEFLRFWMMGFLLIAASWGCTKILGLDENGNASNGSDNAQENTNLNANISPMTLDESVTAIVADSQRGYDCGDINPPVDETTVRTFLEEEFLKQDEYPTIEEFAQYWANVYRDQADAACASGGSGQGNTNANENSNANLNSNASE